MAHFIAVGTIANDIVRKETRNGVLATFRLVTGQPRHGQVWIDVESWGHLAGTVHQHGHAGRAVLVAGRITQKTWHDRATGEARCRYVITANDIDLLDPSNQQPELTNAATISGHTDTQPTTRTVSNGHVTQFRVSTGRTGSKTGRLWIDVESWRPDSTGVHPAKGDAIAVRGRLAYRRPPPTAERTTGTFYIAASELSAK